MTYPASGSQNQWGFYAPASTYEYPADGGTPPAPSILAPPQSPSGSVTGESANSNFTSGETSTETYLRAFGETEEQQGSPTLNAPNPFGANLPGGVMAQTFRWE
jgi:hypothetical protein